MQSSFFNALQKTIRTAQRWFHQTPDRAIDQAYEAALKIKALEDEHFGGQKIAGTSTQYNSNTLAFFQIELRKYLKITEVRLREFRASKLIANPNRIPPENGGGGAMTEAITQGDQFELTLEKLKFIDQVLNRYKPSQSTALIQISSVGDGAIADLDQSNSFQQPTVNYPVDSSTEDEGMLDKTGVLPRSILGTVNRIKQELDPRSEQRVVQSFRSSKAKTLISIRFVLLLIIIPLLTQQISKALILPLVEHYRSQVEEVEVFINFELEESALRELRTFEERLHFDQLLGRSPHLSEEETNERLKEKVGELAQVYQRQSSNAITNVFADGLSLLAFGIVVFFSQREITVLKSFIDETIYGLSDSAKAFIIILFTDMFVGFHSPHGWEVLLEGVAKHLGLPASRDFIFLFIATFPVILDTIFKYWIFRYLNRISPSAVATYRSMNE